MFLILKSDRNTGKAFLDLKRSLRRSVISPSRHQREKDILIFTLVVNLRRRLKIEAGPDGV